MRSSIIKRSFHGLLPQHHRQVDVEVCLPKEGKLCEMIRLERKIARTGLKRFPKHFPGLSRPVPVPEPQRVLLQTGQILWLKMDRQRDGLAKLVDLAKAEGR